MTGEAGFSWHMNLAIGTSICFMTDCSNVLLVYTMANEWNYTEKGQKRESESGRKEKVNYFDLLLSNCINVQVFKI